MFVRELGPSTNNRYLRSKSSITLASAKSEASIDPTTPQPQAQNVIVQPCNRIALNVCGTVFETLEDTLLTFPDTLLGNPDRRKEFYDETRGEYRFQRDPVSFDAILFYYQSKGILAKPSCVKRTQFEKELDFFGIAQHFDKRNEFEKKQLTETETELPVPNGDIRALIWGILERPRSSYAATAVGFFSFGLIVISVLSFCAETIPELKIKQTLVELNVTDDKNTTKLTRVIIYGTDYWYHIETVCIAWFTLEYLLRFYSAPSRLAFISSSLGFVDLFSIIPYYIALALQVRQQGSGLISTFGSIRMLRLLRIIRVFKLTRYNEGLRILVMTVYESAVHLRSLFLVILIMAVLFAAMVFYAESESSKKSSVFSSIPDSFWYTIITMTTVGYGDVFPQTVGGKIAGAICATFGVLLFCLPSPILVNKFIECYYLRQQTSEDDTPERKAFVESMKEIYFNQ
eukprot:gene12114-13365_t